LPWWIICGLTLRLNVETVATQIVTPYNLEAQISDGQNLRFML